jgi:hypothetical protein
LSPERDAQFCVFQHIVFIDIIFSLNKLRRFAEMVNVVAEEGAIMGTTENSRKASNVSLSDENDIRLGKILWLLADEYKLSTTELSILLDVKGRTIQSARQHQAKLPCSSYDRYRRVGLLLGIKKNLEIIFPRDSEVRQNWLRIPRDAFDGKSALEMIMEEPIESMARLFSVRRLLDMQRVGLIEAVV